MKMEIFTGVVLVDKKFRIYLIKEEDKNKIGKGRWNLPGGSIDKGESITESVQRETLEETGYRSKAGSVVGIYHCCKGRVNWLYIVFGSEVVEVKRITVKDTSVVEGKWFEKEEFLRMDNSLLVHPDMKLVYKRVIGGKIASFNKVKFIDYDKE
jgi:8-oxo-dGTP pyrophosphatase MutT (NUDIX family)